MKFLLHVLGDYILMVHNVFVGFVRVLRMLLSVKQVPIAW
jgi:hypothetical protein